MSEMSKADLDRRAREILVGNDRGGYTVPNGRVYPFQWNWDSAFVALGFATFDQDRAWTEIETLFKAQWDDGFLPHIVFWKDDPGYFPGPDVWSAGKSPRTSGITQPPVAASVVRILWEAADQAAFRFRLEALFPKLMAWHRWFHRFRDPDRKGVVVATHPWETGRDNSAEWDGPASAVDVSGVGEYQRRDTSHLDQSMRPTKLDYDRYLALVQFGRATGWDHARIAAENPFRVADVGMTMILLRANRDLLALARALDRPREAEEIQGWLDLAPAAGDYLWDPELGAYSSRDVITGRSCGALTSASFLSFYGDVRDPARDKAMLAHAERIAGQVDRLMPSLDPADPRFEPLRYWRGPVWAVVNYLVGTGFAHAGHADWGERVRRDTGELIRATGFHEAYNPITSAPSGGDDFSWTAAIWLHWAGR
jgi:glycogen debranching enzyme